MYYNHMTHRYVHRTTYTNRTMLIIPQDCTHYSNGEGGGGGGGLYISPIGKYTGLYILYRRTVDRT